MNQQRNEKRSTSQMFGFSVLAGSLIATVFGAAAGWGDIITSEGNFSKGMLLLVVFSFSLSACIFAGFANFVQKGGPKFNNPILAACLGSLLLATLELTKQIRLINEQNFLIANSGLQILIVWGTVKATIELLKLSGSWRFWSSTLSTVAIAGFCGYQTFESRALIGTLPTTFGVARDIISFISISTIIIACGAFPGLKLNQSSFVDSILLRLRDKKSENISLYAFVALLVSLPLSSGIMIWGISNYDPTAASMQMPSAIYFGYFGFMVLSWNKLENYFEKTQLARITNNLTASHAKNFIFTHQSKDKQWATSVGLRSSEYLIDHDPTNQMHSDLPATIMQIRTEEIRKFIEKSTDDIILHQDVVGHRIFGGINPNVSIRPCIDAVRLMACLYLDATPLIERRLKGIVGLLPLVDPGLASKLKVNDIDVQVQKNHWFFYVDYSWIDQFMIHRGSKSRYGVRLNPLESKTRHAMMDHSRSIGLDGNTIWLTQASRDQLLKEAPSLSKIITACPIKADNGKGEELFFTVKFEDLIPQLQQFYTLDAMRKNVIDYEPSVEAIRVLGLLNKRLAKSDTIDSLQELAHALSSYPWHGFKEKDDALAMVLKIWGKISSRIDEQTDKISNYRPSFLTAVLNIGYPSQFIHLAQIDKLNLRDIDSLMDVAKKVRHKRFRESWLLLSTKDFGIYDLKVNQAVLSFLKSSSTSAPLVTFDLLATRLLDTYIGVGLSGEKSLRADLINEIPRLIKWFCQRGEGPDHMNYLFDRIKHVEAVTGHEFYIDDSIMDSVRNHLQKTRDLLGKNNFGYQAFLNRWQFYENQQKPISQAS